MIDGLASHEPSSDPLPSEQPPVVLDALVDYDLVSSEREKVQIREIKFDELSLTSAVHRSPPDRRRCTCERSPARPCWCRRGPGRGSSQRRQCRAETRWRELAHGWSDGGGPSGLALLRLRRKCRQPWRLRRLQINTLQLLMKIFDRQLTFYVLGIFRLSLSSSSSGTGSSLHGSRELLL